MEELLNLLPMLPWEGPPLPKFLGITWVSLFQLPQLSAANTQKLLTPGSREFVKSTDITPYTAPLSIPTERIEITPKSEPTPALATYNNEEITEVEWNENGFPTKIVTHRHAVKQSNE